MKILILVMLLNLTACSKLLNRFLPSSIGDINSNRDSVNILVLGQSNAVNGKESPFEIYSKYGAIDIVYLDKAGQVANIAPTKDNQHYRDASWCILADLIYENTGRKTNIYNFAVGGTTTEQWANDLYKWIDYANANYNYDFVIWIQGESDANYIPDDDSYKYMVDTFSHIASGKIIFCAYNGISRVQKRIIDDKYALAGPDFCSARWYHKEYFTPNEAHLDILGFQWHAGEWFRILCANRML